MIMSYTSYTQFDVEDRLGGKVKIAYLNQPETFNALNRMVLKELKEFMEKCDDDPEVRCIAVSGRGQAFSSGQNIKNATDLVENIDETNIIKKIVRDYYNPMVLSVVKNKKPVIALVNGGAVGAGAMLALICDFAVATESAYFSQAFSAIGLIPDTAGTYYLPRLLGKQMASYLAFTGKKISAAEAKQIGLIADVFKDEDFIQQSENILEEIANKPTKALGLTKRAFLHSYDNSLVEQLEMEAVFQQKAAESKDFAEGITAFLEKRKPDYIGK